MCSGRLQASAQSVRQLLDDDLPNFTICAGNGAPCASTPLTCSARELVGEHTAIFPAQPVAAWGVTLARA